MCVSWQSISAIAQLAEHLTVELCSYQMVPGSIPDGRTCKCERQDKARFVRQMQHSYPLASAAHLPSYIYKLICKPICKPICKLICKPICKPIQIFPRREQAFEKRKASCFLLDVLVRLGVSFFIKNLQMPLKQVCK